MRDYTKLSEGPLCSPYMVPGKPNLFSSSYHRVVAGRGSGGSDTATCL